MWCVLALCGLLTGVVRDSGGAVVPGATITIANASQAESRSTVTDDQGRFEVRDLPQSSYTVTATYAGFEPAVRTIDVGTDPDSVTYNVWTPKAAVHLRLAPEAFAYASATRGFKSGGFNLTTPVPGRAYVGTANVSPAAIGGHPGEPRRWGTELTVRR